MNPIQLAAPTLDFCRPAAVGIVRYAGAPHAHVLWHCNEGGFSSVLCVYSLDSSRKPKRVFHSFERVTSVDATSRCLVCGTAAGSVLLFDLAKQVGL